MKRRCPHCHYLIEGLFQGGCPYCGWKSPSKRRQREHLVDIFREGGRLRVVAEVPGVQEDDIKVDVRDGLMTIGAPDYYREVNLPWKGVVEIREMAYRNGVLEVQGEYR